MSNIISINDVQRASDEYKVVSTILIEILEKHKYLNNIIDRFRHESDLFAECIGETQLELLIVKLADKLEKTQEIEQTINKMLMELMVMVPDKTKTQKGDD